MLYWPDHLSMFRNYVFDSRFPCVQTHKTEHRLRGAVGVDVHSRFGVNADARQAQRDSELTEVNAMRKTTSAIHYAVHVAAKGMLKIGVTELVIPPQLRSWNF